MTKSVSAICSTRRVKAVSFARCRVRSDLDTDRQLVLSLVKDIEIVGEAASQVSESFRTQAPEIP